MFNDDIILLKKIITDTNFFLFPKLKTTMKGKRFIAIEKLKEKLEQELLAI